MTFTIVLFPQSARGHRVRSAFFCPYKHSSANTMRRRCLQVQARPAVTHEGQSRALLERAGSPPPTHERHHMLIYADGHHWINSGVMPLRPQSSATPAIDMVYRPLKRLSASHGVRWCLWHWLRCTAEAQLSEARSWGELEPIAVVPAQLTSPAADRERDSHLKSELMR